jgi:hypothetical protein
LFEIIVQVMNENEWILNFLFFSTMDS